MQTAIVIGIGSDIGRELARRLLSDRWRVLGTQRGEAAPRDTPEGAESTRCDLASPESVVRACAWLEERCTSGWDLLVVAAGTEEPVGPFWSCDADEWDRGMQVNALMPLRMVRNLYACRSAGGRAAVVFFSGSGSNGAAPCYSAYAGSKVFLTKMCELLDAESEDTAFFIIGPGVVRTKIHQQTLDARERGGSNYRKVVDFLRSTEPGTSHDDIYGCLAWCMAVGKRVIGGRNISLVHDAWRQGGAELASWLEQDSNRYKLRRHGNEHRLAGRTK